MNIKDHRGYQESVSKILQYSNYTEKISNKTTIVS